MFDSAITNVIALTGGTFRKLPFYVDFALFTHTLTLLGFHTSAGLHNRIILVNLLKSGELMRYYFYNASTLNTCGKI